MQPLYDPEAVRPLWEDLATCGIQPLRSAAEVDAAIERPGTTMVVVNSVCGCAAGNARPGVTFALQGPVIPDHLTTVFAGVDREATDRTRGRMPQIQPSSPSIFIFKDGALVYALERRHIERMTAEAIALELRNAFAAHCSRTGPSVPPEVYQSIGHTRVCGSQIPTFAG